MGHRLTDRDPDSLTATCSACGPNSSIAKNGKRGFVCREARREARRRWRAAHPDRARADRRRPASSHRLEKRDGSPDRCAVCGPVIPVVMGRGYGCPTRAKELGWKVFPEAPQPACHICRTYLDRFGSCAKCEEDQAADDMFVPAEARRHWRNRASAEGWLEAGFTVSDFGTPLPDDTESVVPGWKTLGSLDPVGSRPTVRPDYAALYGSGRK